MFEPTHDRHALWGHGAKTGIGTARSAPPEGVVDPSRLWFTLVGGAVTEVLYPTIDIANTQELHLLIGAADGSFLHDSRTDCRVTTTLTDRRALAYTLSIEDYLGRYRLVVRICTDPEAPTLLLQCLFEPLRGTAADYRIAIRLMPRLGGRGDAGSACTDPEAGQTLCWKEDVACALLTDRRWLGAAIAPDPGEPEVRELFAAAPGEPQRREGDAGAVLAMLSPGPHWQVALGFGSAPDAALAAARQTLARGGRAVHEAYLDGWHRWCAALAELGDADPDFAYLCAMVIKAHEDKTYRGAIVASLSMPWGDRETNAAAAHGYRYIWARDLYHAAMALLACGDRETPKASLRYIDEVLQEPNGYVPQNAWVSGPAHWKGLQLDQVAAAILLAWRLDATDRYGSLVAGAARFLAEHGPSTPQERWEENGGYSPASLAAEVAALVCAADLARRAGAADDAAAFLATADAWRAGIDGWTLCERGPAEPRGRYYLRIAPSGEPDRPELLRLANGGPLIDQRRVVDPSFLELVRLGLERPDSPAILDSLPVVDRLTRAETPRGPCWYRYNGDHYGDGEDGVSPFARDAAGQHRGIGRPWPLLAGERGMYHLIAGEHEEARRLLEHLEAFANEGRMLPEQVFERDGSGTNTATPLVWAHAEYLVLHRSLRDGSAFDLPAVVAERYAGV